MDPIIKAVIEKILGESGQKLLENSGRKLRQKLLGSPVEQALDRCLDRALKAMVTAVGKLTKEGRKELATAIEWFFVAPGTVSDFARLLKGRKLDQGRLVEIFRDVEDEHGLDPLAEDKLRAALIAYESTFNQAVSEEAELRDILGINLEKRKADAAEKAAESTRDIAAGIRAPQEKARHPAAARREAYLSHVFDSARRLQLEGIDPKAAGEAKEQLNLEGVYTALLTGKPELEGRQPDEGEEEQPAGKVRYLSALENLNAQKYLALLGDPGSGKSTFVNFVALSWPERPSVMTRPTWRP